MNRSIFVSLLKNFSPIISNTPFVIKHNFAYLKSILLDYKRLNVANDLL